MKKKLKSDSPLDAAASSASSCCGAGVSVASGMEGTNWWVCRLCGDPCDAISYSKESSCPKCHGPLSLNWNEGKSYLYCLEHGEPNSKKVCKPWTESEIYKLRRLAGTMPAKNIAEKLGRSIESIKSKAQGIGILLRQFGENHHCSKYSDEFVENARRLHDSGLSQRKVAAKIGVSYGVVREWLDYSSRSNDRVIL